MVSASLFISSKRSKAFLPVVQNCRAEASAAEMQVPMHQAQLPFFPYLLTQVIDSWQDCSLCAKPQFDKIIGLRQFASSRPTGLQESWQKLHPSFKQSQDSFGFIDEHAFPAFEEKEAVSRRSLLQCKSPALNKIIPRKIIIFIFFKQG